MCACARSCVCVWPQPLQAITRRPTRRTATAIVGAIAATTATARAATAATTATSALAAAASRPASVAVLVVYNSEAPLTATVAERPDFDFIYFSMGEMAYAVRAEGD